MTDETLRVLCHIFDARIYHANNADSYTVGTSAHDIIEYALVDYLECLVQFDDWETEEE